MKKGTICQALYNIDEKEKAFNLFFVYKSIYDFTKKDIKELKEKITSGIFKDNDKKIIIYMINSYCEAFRCHSLIIK